MAKPTYSSKAQPNGINGEHRAKGAASDGGLGRGEAVAGGRSSAEPDQWGEEVAVSQEVDRVLSEGLERIHALENGKLIETDADGPEDIEKLRAENIELRLTLAKLQERFEDLAKSEQGWAAQQKEYESLLDEKSEVIRELHMKMQETQEMKERPGVAPPREEELLALSEELERERRQLKDDEESLMKQMRDMEIQMSRERAEFARQRTEIQRLHSEIRHELELASRDAVLRERLAPLMRRQQEIMSRRGSAPPPPDSPTPAAQPSPGREQATKKDSGLLRKFFG